mgnify:CR=1 FL=1
MSPDPAAPERLHDLVDAFAQTTQAVIDLGRGCGVQDLALPTECPGWTVHAQLSHAVGVEAWPRGHKDPGVQVPPYEPRRTDPGKPGGFEPTGNKGSWRRRAFATPPYPFSPPTTKS